MCLICISKVVIEFIEQRKLKNKVHQYSSDLMVFVFRVDLEHVELKA